MDTTPPTATRDVAATIDALTRVVQDWPSPGVQFRDLTPLLADVAALGQVVDAMAEAARAHGPIDVVAGIEARGFIFGPAVAMALGIGFVPIRKAGKLPAEVHAATYELEYGTATLEVHTDAIGPGQRVLLVDDVLATGGTLAAADQLVRACGATTAAASVPIEIAPLGGREKLAPLPVDALRSYP